MIKTFTKNDIVRFLYDEVNEDEKADINDAMLSDFELHEHVGELRSAMESLDTFEMKAPSGVVSRILYASKNVQSV
ncbi:MAG: hypothetical protein AB8B73_05935 [Ekhidna sp.]